MPRSQHSGVGMVGRERLLVDRQSALEEGFGLLIAPLLPVEEGQAIEGDGGFGVVEWERVLADRQGVLVRMLHGGIFARFMAG